MSSLDRLSVALADRYRVDRELGAGGMATVYLAHDLRHERDVAIKVLHPDLGAALGAERFLSEIKTTAKLQHPHILPLLESGAADGLLYYVMPYVRGETLRARLDRERQVPVDDAVRIAREVASALEHAHKQGVIHRDIKPENILLQDGAALVADFGIALAVQQAGGARMTQTGLSLGTPQYMSPEQATGERTIDARSDIYALGAVTYEMLAGEPPFTGPSIQAIVARLLSEEPRSISAQRKAVEPHVEGAVLRALEKLPADRFVSAADFSAALVTPGVAQRATGGRASRASTTRAQMPTVMRIGVAAALATVGAAGWWIGQRGQAADAADQRLAFDIRLGAGSHVAQDVAISRDGRLVATVLVDSAGQRAIRVRDLATDSVRIVAGSEGAQTVTFSPDGKGLAFVGEGSSIRRIPLEGGQSTVLANGSNTSRLLWAADDFVYFTGNGSTGIQRVSVQGGAVTTMSRPDPKRREFTHWDPMLLPDQKTLLFFSYAFPADSSRVELLDLATGKRTPLVSHATNPRLAPGGFLTFLRDGVVYAIRFDPSARQVSGAAVPVLTNVAWEFTSGRAAYDVSANGTLAYVRRSTFDIPRTVVELNREGREMAVLTPPGLWAQPRLSPDGRYLMAARNEDTWHLWLLDRRNNVLTQFTRGANASFSAVWAPDSRSVLHIEETPVYDVFRRWLDGTRVDTVLSDSVDKVPTGISPDGRTVAFLHMADENEVMLRTGDSTRHLPNAGIAAAAVISPDGKWIAYQEAASGRGLNVFVQSLAGGGRRQVSAAGGAQPRWSRGGRELVFRRGDAVLAAPFDPASGEVGPQQELFRRRQVGTLNGSRDATFDVSPDGDRLFLVVPAELVDPPTIAVVQRWDGDFARRLAR
jgi:serine/threonine-protein kinase